MNEKIQQAVRGLQRFTHRIWYPPFIGLLAALDNLVLVIPNDGILISSAMLYPKRWFAFALSVAIGSTVGALVLAHLVDSHGLPWILEFFPGLTEGKTWQLTESFFKQYGLLLVFVVAVTPFVQQPAVILATLSGTPAYELALVIFSGRFIKFLIMAYAGGYAPQLLSKMWGVGGELKEVGLPIEKTKK